MNLPELKRLAEAATQRLDGHDLAADPYGLQVWGRSRKDGLAHVVDIRGWGYLTGRGHGALGLSEEEGIAAQKAVQAYLVAAWNNLPALISRIEEMEGALEEAREFIDRYSDVRDGDYGGVEPNEAMQIVHAIDQALKTEGA